MFDYPPRILHNLESFSSTNTKNDYININRLQSQNLTYLTNEIYLLKN